MSKRQLIIILGVWIMAFLFLGFPSAWDKVFALVTGFLLCVVAFKLDRPSREEVRAQVPFVEHKNSTIPVRPATASAPASVSATPIINPDTTATS